MNPERSRGLHIRAPGRECSLMSMIRPNTAAAVLATVALCGVTLWQTGPSLTASEDQHAYFNSLVSRRDHWKSFSLRAADQVSSTRVGGYAQLRTGEVSGVTYDPAQDTDRHRQDATKVTIPAFIPTTQLAQPVGSTDTTLTLVTAYKPNYPPGRVIRVDSEVMTVVSWLTDTTVSVARGAYGTSKAGHSGGASVMHSTNSLRTQIRLPLGTEDGHDYFFTWDSYWTDSYVGAGNFQHKIFQFSSGGKDGDTLWFEPHISYGSSKHSCFDPGRHVGGIQVRSYNKLGGGADWSQTDGNLLGPRVTKENPVTPFGHFCVEPNTWVRFFLRLRQRANDYDLVDLWASDERQDPVQVLTNIPVSVRPSGLYPNSIAKFWVEFNSSDDEYMRIDGRDLVSYVRNFVALLDPSDVSALLVRPTPGAEPTIVGPAPPYNLRIVR